MNYLASFLLFLWGQGFWKRRGNTAQATQQERWRAVSSLCFGLQVLSLFVTLKSPHRSVAMQHERFGAGHEPGAVLGAGVWTERGPSLAAVWFRDFCVAWLGWRTRADEHREEGCCADIYVFLTVSGRINPFQTPWRCWEYDNLKRIYPYFHYKS